jgi:hypothetical protein
MDTSEPITPLHPRWLVERRITRMLENHLGEEWSRRHQALAHRMLNLWQGGVLHERQLEDWLLGRIRLD